MSPSSGNGTKPTTKPRQRNQQDVLDALLGGDRLTQQDLVHQTGLSRATIARVTTALIESKLVEPEKGVESPAGVPIDVLSIRASAGAAMGIDFGKKHVRVAVRDIGGGKEVIREPDEELDVPNESERSLNVAVELARKTLREASFAPEDLVAIYVGVPAPVDFQGRLAQNTGMPDWLTQKPAEELKDRLLWDVPIYAANDASLGAIAELEWGAAHGCSNVVYMKWSAGVGGGVIVDGRLVRGANNLAGEIGHALVPGVKSPTKCDECGLVGCLESVVGGKTITQGFDGVNELSDLVREARKEDASGPHRKVLTRAAGQVGQALGPIVSTLNPEVLVIGGAFYRAEGDYELIADPLRRGLKATAYPASLDLKIRIGTQTGKAAVLGGVALVLREHLRQFLFDRL